MKKASGGIGVYLKQIGRHKLLTREQEVELSKRIEAGRRREWTERDKKTGKLSRKKYVPTEEQAKDADRARKRMIESNLRLVVSIAKGHQNRGCDLDDLIAEGNLGLMKGVERFDWRRGFRFSTYGSWWIRQAIGRLVANQGRSIRVSGRASAISKELQAAREEFIELNGQEPTRAELADLVGVTETTVSATLSGLPYIVSLDMPIGSEDSGRQLKDVIEDVESDSPFDLVDRKELVALVSKVLDTLPAREDKILRMRFGISEDPSNHENFPITQREIDGMMKEN